MDTSENPPSPERNTSTATPLFSQQGSESFVLTNSINSSSNSMSVLSPLETQSGGPNSTSRSNLSLFRGDGSIAMGSDGTLVATQLLTSATDSSLTEPKKSQVGHYQQKQALSANNRLHGALSSERRSASASSGFGGNYLQPQQQSSLQQPSGDGSIHSFSGLGRLRHPSAPSASSFPISGHERGESASSSAHSQQVLHETLSGSTLLNTSRSAAEVAYYDQQGGSRADLPLVVGGGDAIIATMTPPATFLDPMSSSQRTDCDGGPVLHRKKSTAQVRSSTPSSTLVLERRASFAFDTQSQRDQQSAPVPPSFPTGTTILGKKTSRVAGREVVRRSGEKKQGPPAPIRSRLWCRARDFTDIFLQKPLMLPVLVAVFVISMLATSTAASLDQFKNTVLATNRHQFHQKFVNAMKMQQRLNNHSITLRAAIQRAQKEVDLDKTKAIRQTVGTHLAENKQALVQYLALRKERREYLEAACDVISCGDPSRDVGFLISTLRQILPEGDLPTTSNETSTSISTVDTPIHASVSVQGFTPLVSITEEWLLNGSCPNQPTPWSAPALAGVVFEDSPDFKWRGQETTPQGYVIETEPVEILQLVHEEDIVAQKPLPVVEDSEAAVDESDMWTVELDENDYFAHPPQNSKGIPEDAPDSSSSDGPRKPKGRRASVLSKENMETPRHPKNTSASPRWSWWTAKLQSTLRYCIFVALVALWIRLD